MENKYKNLLASSVDSFYEAKSSNKEKEKLYFKGITEGMMQIIREADLLSLYDIDHIIDSAKEKYMVKADGNQKGFDPEDLDIPAYIRKGKSIST